MWASPLAQGVLAAIWGPNFVPGNKVVAAQLRRGEISPCLLVSQSAQKAVSFVRVAEECCTVFKGAHALLDRVPVSHVELLLDIWYKVCASARDLTYFADHMRSHERLAWKPCERARADSRLTNLVASFKINEVWTRFKPSLSLMTYLRQEMAEEPDRETAVAEQASFAARSMAPIVTAALTDFVCVLDKYAFLARNRKGLTPDELGCLDMAEMVAPKVLAAVEDFLQPALISALRRADITRPRPFDPWGRGIFPPIRNG
jgi:hypothetical protein